MLIMDIFGCTKKSHGKTWPESGKCNVFRIGELSVDMVNKQQAMDSSSLDNIFVFYRPVF